MYSWVPQEPGFGDCSADAAIDRRNCGADLGESVAKAATAGDPFFSPWLTCLRPKVGTWPCRSRSSGPGAKKVG